MEQRARYLRISTVPGATEPLYCCSIQSGTLFLAVTSFCVAFVDNPCDKAPFRKMGVFHF